MGIPISQLPQANTSNNSDVLPLVQNGETKKITKQLLFNAIISMLGSEYSVTSTYAVGDYCIYNGILYQCTTAIITPEEWDGSKWVQANLGDGIESKVTKVAGMGLSTNDYTDADKNKVDNMPVAQNNYSTSTTNPYSADYANNTILGTVLYENTTGTTGNITLSDNIENYDYVEIQSYVIYTDTPVYTNTGRIPTISAGRIHINNFFIAASLPFMAYNKRISISNKSLTVASDRYYSTAGGSAEGSYTYITKIIGYKNP